MTGLYIHIPFCASRCIYCGFYSTVHPEWQNRYVSCLGREMRLRQPLEAERPCLSTVYLGGGTPSQLSMDNLRRLFLYINKVYRLDFGAEVTIECNPDDVCRMSDDDVCTLASLANRVSMGAQTFDDRRLSWLRRRHNAAEISRAVERLRAAGIGNISIDLMFGFPGETLDDWQHDIGEALALGVEHVSAYSLMYEEGTPLYALLRRGEVKEVDEELSLRMYDLLADRLTAAGYEHYEISNFARHGFRSRHNSSYWHEVPYIGIGAAAHSYDLKTRSWNVADIGRYMDSIERGVVPSESETIDDDTRYDDLVTTALRTSEGIRLDRLDAGHRKFLLNAAQPYIDRRQLVVEDGRLHLTRAGIYISNLIMSDLMDV